MHVSAHVACVFVRVSKLHLFFFFLSPRRSEREIHNYRETSLGDQIAENEQGVCRLIFLLTLRGGWVGDKPAAPGGLLLVVRYLLVLLLQFFFWRDFFGGFFFFLVKTRDWTRRTRDYGTNRTKERESEQVKPTERERKKIQVKKKRRYNKFIF